MHKIEQAIQAFLENLDTTDKAALEPLIEEFGENCKKAIRECLLANRSQEPFRLRMSNIGRPLRQLLLEKLHGQAPADPQMKLKATYGYMWESFLFFLLKASGLDIKTNQQVELKLNVGEGQSYTVTGTMDCTIDGDIYDIKSASSWSFDNKFKSFETVADGDLFGYVGQGLGYSIASKKYFAGWIVVDKSDGRIKVVPVHRDNYKSLAQTWLNDFKHKVKTLFFTETPEMPPCTCVVDETFRKKETGNKILNKQGEFCSYKYKCHPKLQFKECCNSQAETKNWKYYVEINEKN